MIAPMISSQTDKRLMGLDIGTKRIGVALSDPLLISAQPHKTIDRSKGDKKTLLELESLIKDFGVYKIIVGLPLELSGKLGAQAESVETFVRKLKSFEAVEVEMLDERMTSKQAESMLKDKRLKGAKGMKR